MAQYVADTLTRGQSGLGQFAVAKMADLQLASTIAVDPSGRDAIEAWRRTPYMTAYVVSEDKTYRLGSDVTIAGQVWTEIVMSDANALVYSDVFGTDGYFLPSKMRNLFINDAFVVSSQAAMLALSTVTGNVVVRSDTSQVFLKINNDDPSDITDFANITSNAGAVTSVNGQTGTVLITIANLLSDSTNLTNFNTAVSNNSTVLSHSGSIASLTTNKADLVSGTVPLAELPYLFQSGLTRATNEVKLGGALLYDTEIALGTFNFRYDATGTGKPKIDFGSDASNDILIRGTSGYLSRFGVGSDGQFLKSQGGLLVWGAGGGTGSSTFVGLTDVPSSYVGNSLKAVRVNSGESALEFYTPSGSGTFITLTDVPNSYSGAGLKLVRVNAAATGLEFFVQADAAADGTTKGIATFTANDFNATSGLISIDYTNGQSASTTLKGFLTNTDWNTFNNKLGTANVDNSTIEISGGNLRVKPGGITNTQLSSGAAVANIGYTPVNKAGDTMLGFLTLSADPTNALHAATKNYIDNLITGLTWKNEVATSTTANITLSGEQTIDGVLTSSSRVLVKNQTNQTENGIYISNSGAWTRSLDADTGTELAGATVFVSSGTSNGNTQWSCSNTSITIGVTNVTFVQIAGAGVYTNGTGLSLTGNAFSVTTNGITNSLIRQSAGLSVIGNATNSTANVTDITASVDGQVLLRSGTTLGFGTVAAIGGGTGQTVYAVGDILYASTTTALSKLADVATGSALISGGVGAAPSYGKIGLTTHISGTLAVGNGGTNITSYAIGDLIQASASTTLAKLAAVATGNVLISGGVTTVSSWGKVGLTTHVSGTLAIGNGGTGTTAGAYTLDAGGTATVANTFTHNFPNGLNYAGTFTTTANTQTWKSTTINATLRATASDSFVFDDNTHNVNITSTNQKVIGYEVMLSPIQTGPIAVGGFSIISAGLSGMSVGTTTGVSPASTSGSGTGATFDITRTAGAFTSITLNAAGTGYKVNDIITFNGSQFSGSGTTTYLINTVTGVSIASNSSAFVIKRGETLNLNTTQRYLDFVSNTGTSVLSFDMGQNAAGNLFTLSDATGSIFSVSTTAVAFSRAINLPTSTSYAVGFTGGGTVSGTATRGIGNTANFSFGVSANNVAGRFVSSGGITNSGLINTLNNASLVGGSGYTNGSFTTLAVTGGSGSGATISGTVAGGAVTSVTVVTRGTNYRVGDVISAAVPGGTGFTIPVATVDAANNIAAGFWYNDSYTDPYTQNKYYGFYGNPTFNLTSSTTANIAGFYWNPTLNSVLGRNDGVIIVPTTATSGFGTATPSSNLESGGSFGSKIDLSTGNLTLSALHTTIIITTGTGSYTLPTASGANNRIYIIVNQTGTARTISTYIDKLGANQTTIASGVSLWLHCNGTSYYQIN